MGLLGRFRKRTGLWTLKAVLEELHGVRLELALMRVLLEEHLRKPVASIQIGAGMRTAAPDRVYEGEPGGVEWTDNETYAAYSEVATFLAAKLGRQPYTDEIEREFLLRMQG